MSTVSIDDIYPRTPEHRYRLVSVSASGGVDVVATAPDAQSLGLMIVTLHEDLRREVGLEARLYDEGRIGILDTCPDGEPSETGDWILLPWQRGDHV